MAIADSVNKTIEDQIVNGIMNLDIPFVHANKYIEAMLIFGIFFLSSQLVILISQKIVLKLTEKTKTDIDNKIVEKTSKPLSLVLILFGILIAFKSLDFIPSVDWVIGRILYSLKAIVVIYIVIKTADIIIDSWGFNFAKKTHSRIDYQLLEIFHKISLVLLSIIGFLIILKTWGVEIGPLLASLGIAGIAVAFALQNTLGNIFGGISVILDKTVKVGDIIRLQDMTQGEVVDVGLRSTKLRTSNNEIVIVPNGRVADAQIHNYALPDARLRLFVEFGVEYGSDIEKVKDIVLKEMRKNPKVLKEPVPYVRFEKMGDFALQFTAYAWIANFQDRVEEKDRLSTAIYGVLTRNNITIPFPTRTVIMTDKKKL